LVLFKGFPAMTLFAAVVLGVPLMAVCFSLYSQSRLSVLLLRWGGGYLLLAMAMSVFIGFDCKFNDYAFRNCHLTPEFIVGVFLVPHLINLFLLAIAVPVWALVLGLELSNHRGEARARPWKTDDL